ncbi:MAG: hypothetical protein M0Z66_05500 [Thermaerobacter sp.]|nr:hypothetical protein [Thermaerobacter sp.]
MRFNVYLPDYLQQEFDEFAAGRSRSAAVRDAILLAVRLEPIMRRLDRIEARLSGAAVSFAAAPSAVPQDTAEVLRRTIAAEPAGFIDDD